MGLQGSLLLQSGGSALGAGEIRETAGRAPLVPALAPAAPLFSGAPSESRSSPSSEGDGLGASAVPCQSIEKSTPTPFASPLLAGGQDRSWEGFEGIYRQLRPHGCGCGEEGSGVLYNEFPQREVSYSPTFSDLAEQNIAMFTVLGLQQVITVSGHTGRELGQVLHLSHARGERGTRNWSYHWKASWKRTGSSP